MSFNKFKKNIKNLSGSRSTRRGRKNEQEFIEAVMEDDMEQLRKLTKEKIKIFAPIFWNEAYVYPIHLGCAQGSLDVVKLLFRLGCTLETKTEAGMTPLHFSAAYNLTHPEVTGHLLDMGARPNIKDKLKGYTPFHYASENNNFGAAKRLLESTKRFIPDNEGKTAKDIAIENDCEQIVSLFEAYDEECKQKEELLRLPGRIENLERKTEFLLRNRGSLQSINNDSGVDGSCGDFHTSGQNLISLHVDNSTRTRRLSASSNCVFRAGSRNRVPSLTITEEQFSSLQAQGALGHAPHNMLNLTLSPTNKESNHSVYHTEEVDSPLTRDSPLGSTHRYQVRRNYSFLHSMVKPEKVIIKLFSKNHLDLEAKQRLDKMPTDQDKNNHILTNYVLKGSMGLYEDFLQSLKDSNQVHIAEKLNSFSESPLYKSTGDIEVPPLSLSLVKESAV